MLLEETIPLLISRHDRYSIIKRLRAVGNLFVRIVCRGTKIEISGRVFATQKQHVALYMRGIQ